MLIHVLIPSSLLCYNKVNYTYFHQALNVITQLLINYESLICKIDMLLLSFYVFPSYVAEYHISITSNTNISNMQYEAKENWLQIPQEEDCRFTTVDCRLTYMESRVCQTKTFICLWHVILPGCNYRILKQECIMQCIKQFGKQCMELHLHNKLCKFCINSQLRSRHGSTLCIIHN